MKPQLSFDTNPTADNAMFLKLIESDEGFIRLFDQFSPMLYGLILKNVNNLVQADCVLLDAFQTIRSRFHEFNPLHTRLTMWMICIVKEKLRKLSCSKMVGTMSGCDNESSLDLMYTYGFSVKEVAELKGITETSVKESIRLSISSIRSNA